MKKFIADLWLEAVFILCLLLILLAQFIVPVVKGEEKTQTNCFASEVVEPDHTIRYIAKTAEGRVLSIYTPDSGSKKDKTKALSRAARDCAEWIVDPEKFDKKPKVKLQVKPTNK